MFKNILFSAFLVFGITNAFAQSKIAHLNSQEVMEAMPSYKVAVLKLDSFQRAQIKEFETMKQDFEKSIVIYQEKLAKGGSPALIQLEEQKLARKEQDILERQDNIQLEVQAYSQELNQPVIAKAEKAIKIVSDRHQYEYVFDVSTLMIHNGPDITQEVIAEIVKLE